MLTWQKVGTAYMVYDEFSRLWVRRISGGRWHLLSRTNTGWAKLGSYTTLKQAKREAEILMEGP
jgi:hypothetical protein